MEKLIHFVKVAINARMSRDVRTTFEISTRWAGWFLVTVVFDMTLTWPKNNPPRPLPAVVIEYQRTIPAFLLPNWFLTHHDQKFHLGEIICSMQLVFCK